MLTFQRNGAHGPCLDGSCAQHLSVRAPTVDAMADPEDNPELSRADAVNERIVERGERLHDNELSSADSIGTRAGTLIGFAGVVLTLTVALSRDAFGRGVDLGAVGDPASAVLFLAAVLSLLAAAVQGVRAASPRKRDRMNPKMFSTYRKKRPPAGQLDEHYGRRQQEVIENNADINRKRAEKLQSGFWWLGAGVCLVAAQAVIIGIDRLTEVL